MSMTITITDVACAYIKKRLAKEQGVGFRLSITKTGCSGFSYLPTIIKQVAATDIPIEKNGVTIYIDPTWSHLLDGLQIDYIEEEKSGLKQKRLVFTNPNEGSRCGCGESFHVP
ncbi:MAG: iron-sulfur cluster assembly accessory protein [Gammaproteobacteria bacterium]|nr:MAG: iron-sulfur cluster assembly accessory protein [Gammaproteobacteria bacterium]